MQVTIYRSVSPKSLLMTLSTLEAIVFLSFYVNVTRKHCEKTAQCWSWGMQSYPIQYENNLAIGTQHCCILTPWWHFQTIECLYNNVLSSVHTFRGITKYLACIYQLNNSFAEITQIFIFISISDEITPKQLCLINSSVWPVSSTSF